MASILLGIYCLSLPHTPPQRRAERAYAPGVVVAMIGRRDLLVLVVVSFFIAMAHQFVLVWNSPFLRAILDTGGWGAYEQSISSIGQICELGVLAVLGLLIKRLGYKWTLTLGASAYLARCLLCASVFFFDPPFAGKLLLAGTAQALHGFCFGCFLAVGYMYVDRIAPPDVRGSMQTLYGTFIVSLGFFAGGLVSGKVGDWFTTVVGGATLRDWPLLWLSCAALCAGCVLLMVACFPRVRSPQPS
jgi:MFS family permease